MQDKLQLGEATLDLTRSHVMGILNVTPDSFSDGGQFTGRDDALRHAGQMIEAGASIIDIGGESTRPGAAAVDVQQELDRVIPVIEAVCEHFPVPVSVDTSKPEVMREAVAAGATLINDVRALREPGAMQAAAESRAAICLMHMLGEPRTMQQSPQYKNVVEDVCQFLADRIVACEEAGIGNERIVVDPGFGFGKTLEQNLALLAGLKHLGTLGRPVLAGLSRKSMLGMILDGADVTQRLYASIAGAVISARNGASILRVHDVQPTVEALRVVDALRNLDG